MTADKSDAVAAKGPKYFAGLSSLSEELKPIFRELAEDYRYYAIVHYRKPFVSYDVLADLVKTGWRCGPISSGNQQK